MRVVSIGDLVTDYYYKDDKLIGINGGMTSHNIIANLTKMGIETSVFGCCGDDCQGKLAINSLEKLISAILKLSTILEQDVSMFLIIMIMEGYLLLQRKDVHFVIIKNGMKKV